MVKARAASRLSFLYNSPTLDNNEFTPGVRMFMREEPSRPNQLLLDPAVNTVALGIKFPTRDLMGQTQTIALGMSPNNNVTQYSVKLG